MSKFNRKTEQLKSRVQFVRGKLQKKKGGELLTDAETDDLSDEVIADMIAMGAVEAVERTDPASDQVDDQGGGAAEGDGKPKAGGK